MKRLTATLFCLLAACGAPRAPMPAPTATPQVTRASSSDNTPAKQLFGAIAVPTGGQTLSIGSYAKGCLAGAVALPETGPTWQVMRLSRNRNWGTPNLVGLHRAVLAEGGAYPRLAGDLDRRHVAAARRADDHRPCQPPDRAGRRYLDDAAAPA